MNFAIYLDSPIELSFFHELEDGRVSEPLMLRHGWNWIDAPNAGRFGFTPHDNHADVTWFLWDSFITEDCVGTCVGWDGQAATMDGSMEAPVRTNGKDPLWRADGMQWKDWNGRRAG